MKLTDLMALTKCEIRRRLVFEILVVLGFIEAIRRWLRYNWNGKRITLLQVILDEAPR